VPSADFWQEIGTASIMDCGVRSCLCVWGGGAAWVDSELMCNVCWLCGSGARGKMGRGEGG